MTTREAFKFGFLARCIETGLTEKQAEDRVKAAFSLLGGAGWLAEKALTVPGSIIAKLGPWAAAATLAAPVAGGLVGGHVLARATDDDTDIDAAKTDEMLAEYQRLTDQARRQKMVRSFKAVPQPGIRRSVSGF